MVHGEPFDLKPMVPLRDLAPIDCPLYMGSQHYTNKHHMLSEEICVLFLPASSRSHENRLKKLSVSIIARVAATS
jgi:hypothetical protein